MHDITDLNSHFGIGEQLMFSLLGENMVVADINTDLCTARVAIQGAQVLEWAPKGQRSVIWLSTDAKFIPGKSIRGGTPVCWPWFGAHATNSDYPAHGYARTVDWDLLSSELLADGRIKLVFSIQTSDATRRVWPHTSPLECHIFLGNTLELELITRNDESVPIIISEALHTYFAVSDVRQVRVSGLDACEYLDKVDNFNRKTQQGVINFSGEVDRVYLATESKCVIDDSNWKRQIHITKRGSRSTVVWNPWIDKSQAMGDMGESGYLNMLCVESGNAASDVVTIEPAKEHRLWVRYHVES